jgi:hypothetical protein
MSVSNAPNRRSRPLSPTNMSGQVLEYLRTPPGPLHDQDTKHSYSAATITLLFERLRDANLSNDLTKAEVLSIINQRPTSAALLYALIEDMETRFSEEDQEKIVGIVADVLGQDEPAEDANGDEPAVPSVEDGAS